MMRQLKIPHDRALYRSLSPPPRRSGGIRSTSSRSSSPRKSPAASAPRPPPAAWTLGFRPRKPYAWEPPASSIQEPTQQGMQTFGWITRRKTCSSTGLPEPGKRSFPRPWASRPWRWGGASHGSSGRPPDSAPLPCPAKPVTMPRPPVWSANAGWGWFSKDVRPRHIGRVSLREAWSRER